MYTSSTSFNTNIHWHFAKRIKHIKCSRIPIKGTHLPDKYKKQNKKNNSFKVKFILSHSFTINRANRQIQYLLYTTKVWADMKLEWKKNIQNKNNNNNKWNENHDGRNNLRQRVSSILLFLYALRIELKLCSFILFVMSCSPSNPFSVFVWVFLFLFMASNVKIYKSNNKIICS